MALLLNSVKMDNNDVSVLGHHALIPKLGIH